MTYPLIQREITIHLHNGNYYIKPLEGTSILGPVDYGWQRYNLYPDSFTMGEGLLAGSSIPGSRRLVICGWSPQWEGFYVSSMGGAAYVFHGLGVNYISLRGRTENPSVLLLNHQNGEIRSRMEPVNAESLWVGKTHPDGRYLKGFFAIQQALFERYENEYLPNKMRILCVGPAALYTREGAIGSSPVQKGMLSPVVDWAGRGGMGSRLLQFHNIAAIIFGGQWSDPDLRDSAELDAYFLEHFGKKTIQTDLALTEKYRYVPEFETGGTFGVNMRELNERILSFNYTSIYASRESRLKQHETFILHHYLDQFNQESIKTKQFQHCGEPCPVVCKKMNNQFKKDYEPYHALGPQIGIFDQRAAETINDHIDSMGLDAIQIGGTLAWIMELITEKLINPEDYGFPEFNKLKFRYTDNDHEFDLVADSEQNCQYAVSMVNSLLFDRRCELFRKGIRSAAKLLDKQLDIRSVDRAVFIGHGEEGYMVPNQYWVPGMFSPMPLMGKYFVYYGVDYQNPVMLGEKNIERMVYELFNENSGICRFHRKWAELITDEIICAHYDIDLKYKNHQFKLVKSISEIELPKAVPWESERIIDLIYGFLESWKMDGLNNPEMDNWLSKFKEDKWNAANEFWKGILSGIKQALEAGPDSVPDQLSPGQTVKQK